jgi:hypothetical protein
MPKGEAVLRELSLEHRAELGSAGSALAAALRAILTRQRMTSPPKTVEPTCTTKLGDFTSTPRMITISGMAVFIGLVSAFVALAYSS